VRRISVVLLVMAMGLVIASPAGAAKPDPDCVQTPNHPACRDDPVEEQRGTTCEASLYLDPTG